MIVGAALFEGPAFFLLITYMLEHSPWSLLAAIVMILGVALHFPTQRRRMGPAADASCRKSGSSGRWGESEMSVRQAPHFMSLIADPVRDSRKGAKESSKIGLFFWAHSQRNLSLPAFPGRLCALCEALAC